MEKFFKLKERGTDVKTEIMAGITTFMTMAYILAVNPGILSASPGMSFSKIFAATAITSCVATLIMGLLANLPFALSAGMGLNAFFAYTVCLGMGYSFQWALTAIFVEGIIFLLLTFLNVREAIVNSIPPSLKKAIAAGIGLFIAFIGLQNAGIIVNSDATLVTLGSITEGKALVGIIGLMITAGLVMAKIRGGILIGIIATAIIGLFIKDPATGDAVTQLLRNEAGGIRLISLPDGLGPIFCKFEWGQILSWDMLAVVFTFLFIDMFDTMGTIIGVHQGAGLIPEDKKRDDVPDMEKMFMADSIATVAGACFGTSTTTTYVESAAGVGAGGRTGLTALSTAVCFALALFLSPIFLAIPGAATAPALVIVGVMMMPSIKRIHWDDYCKAIPAFLTIILMPVSYSISDGILIGVISYVAMHALSGKFKEISIPMWVLAVLFICKYIFI